MSNRNTYISTFTLGTQNFGSRIEQLEWDLKVARERLEAIQELPGVYAAIIGVEGKRTTVCTGQQILEMRKPAAMDGIEPGAVVRLTAGGPERPPAIVNVCLDPPVLGNIAVVKQVVDELRAEINMQGIPRVVFFLKGKKPKPNDRVVLDLTNSVIVRNLGIGDRSKNFTEDTGVTWDDIGGLEEAKAALKEAIEEPVTHKELYARYGRRPTRGALLYGPPGTGKTMLGKACATALARIHGASATAGGFLYVKGPEMLNMYVGNSEANIRTLFASAREHHSRAGYPAIVFIDEADALMGKRGQRGGLEGMERTIVPQFLAEMDGLEDAGCMVLLATNRPDTLDPAVVRDGRVDRKIFIRRPNRDEAVRIFSLHLKRAPAAKGVTHADLAEAGAEALFDDKNALYLLRCKDGRDLRFSLRDLASGAQIAALSDQASQRALRRERDGETTSTGVRIEDMKEVVRQAVKECASLDHTTELSNFVAEKKLDVIKLDKLGV